MEMTAQKDEVKIIGNFNLKPPFRKVYPIYWVIFPEEQEVAYGICGYISRAFVVTSPNNWVKMTTVTSLIIIDGKCQEGERCLVMGCKYNRTTKELYSKAYNIPIHRLEKMWERLISNVNSVVAPAKLIYQGYLEENK
jgi:hypothetical protein